MSDYYEQKDLWDRELTAQEKERITLVSEIIPDDVETILDAGCGSGTLTNSISGYSIVGVDRSKEALKHYQHKQVLGSLDKLDFSDNTFDLIICSDVLEHLPADIYLKTIRELKRVAKKYILIISPNSEDLEANQCKCIQCGTVFHINYHIRSLGIDEIMTLFREDYAPLVYTYFGEPWSSDPPVKYNLKRSTGTGYKHWENALCPLCDTRQEGAVEYDLATDTIVNPSLKGFYNHSTEVMVLLGSIAAKKSFFDFDTLADEKNYLLADKEVKSLQVFHRQYLNTADPAFIKESSRFYPALSYLLKNSDNNWVDNNSGHSRCLYGDNGSQFDHALFVMPYLKSGQTLFVTYVDVATADTLQLNSYCLEQGYINLLELDFTGSGEIKTLSVPLPEHLVPANEGLQFELTVKGQRAPAVPIPFLELYLDNGLSTIQTTSAGNRTFQGKQYVLNVFSNYNELEGNQLLSAPENSYIYHHRFKCLYWNIESLFEYNQDRSYREIRVKEMISYKRYLQLDTIQSRLADEQSRLTDKQVKLGDEQDRLGQEFLQAEDEIYVLREELYSLSNTFDHVFTQLRHPWKSLLERVRRVQPRKIKDSLKNKKHLVILTPDVKIDRRTVQMCQSLISEFDIRCTIIAALKGNDAFVSDMLQVKRVGPHKTKKYRVGRKGAWKDRLAIDLDAFYWLHRQYLYMAMEEDADYLMCCDLPVLPAATYAAKLKDIPLIYDAHELYPEQAIFAEEKRELYKKVEREFIQYPDLVITVNQSIAEEMVNFYDIEQPEVILNALDSPESFDVEERYDYFREQLPIAKETKIVLFQGGYSPNRNLEIFVESAKLLTSTDVVLVLMGFGEYQADLEKVAEKDQTMNSKVFFYPAVDQSVLLHYSASADVGIIPYPHIDLNSYYCTPNKLFEFIQAGLPMITNDSPELNRFVQDNEIGYTKKIESAQDIAEAIDTYFAEKKEYRTNVLKLRERICWSVEETKFNEMFAKVVSER